MADHKHNVSGTKGETKGGSPHGSLKVHDGSGGGVAMESTSKFHGKTEKLRDSGKSKKDK